MSALPPNLSRLSVKAIGLNVVPLTVRGEVTPTKEPNSFTDPPYWYTSNIHIRSWEPDINHLMTIAFRRTEDDPLQAVPLMNVSIRLESRDSSDDVFTNVQDAFRVNQNIFPIINRPRWQEDWTQLQFLPSIGSVTDSDPVKTHPPLLITLDDGEQHRILKCFAVLLAPPIAFSYIGSISEPLNHGILLVKLVMDASVSPSMDQNMVMYGVDHVPSDAFPEDHSVFTNVNKPAIMLESMIRKLVLTCPAFGIPELRRHLYFMPGGQGARDAEERWAKAMPKLTQEFETQVSEKEIDEASNKRLRPIERWRDGQSN